MKIAAHVALKDVQWSILKWETGKMSLNGASYLSVIFLFRKGGGGLSGCYRIFLGGDASWGHIWYGTV